MSTKLNDAIMNTLATLVGGAAGALVSGLLVRLGAKPVVARAGVALAGSAGAVLLPGALGSASAGVAAAGVCQLALGFLEAEQKAKDADRTVSEKNAEQNAEVFEREPTDEVTDTGAVLDGAEEELEHSGNRGPELKDLPGWIPAVALVGLAFLPIILQRILG